MNIIRLKSIVCTLIIGWILLKNMAESQQDPCSIYKEVNDTTMTIGYVLDPSDSSICDTVTPGWTRFTGSDEGLMATGCPSGSQCGSDRQVWMQGSIPSYYNGTTYVDICIRSNGDCCDRQSRLQVKNCNGYMVYNLVFLPPCTRYCFNESSQLLVTVLTTQTIQTTQASHPTNSPNSDFMNSDALSSGEIAGIVIGTLFALAIVTVILIIIIHQFKTKGSTVQSKIEPRRKNE